MRKFIGNEQLKAMLIVGARPNFMKIAPLIKAIQKHNESIKSEAPEPQAACSKEITCNPGLVTRKPIDYLLVHTGQHYDLQMSETFFQELEIPKPDINLEVGSGSHASQTAEIMKRFEPVLLEHKPDVVIVVGDVNSTLACALTASKIQFPTRNSEFGTRNSMPRPLIAHVEAGLRSFDRSMPEEINRIVTDSLSDFLFTPSEDADENLLNEGIPPHKIKRVGNIMIDTLTSNLEKARGKKTYEKFGLRPKNYVFVTIHRPNNVDNNEVFSFIMNKLTDLSQKIPVIFPVHPRTKKQLIESGLIKNYITATQSSITSHQLLNISHKSPTHNHQNLKLLDPIGYHDTISLVENSRFVLTDSGGLQEETTFLGVPCLTLRPSTERPITIKLGTNKLTSFESLERDFDNLFNGHHPKGQIPDLWDGYTSYRIIKIIIRSMLNPLDHFRKD